jgi:hypothetical protein
VQTRYDRRKCGALVRGDRFRLRCNGENPVDRSPRGGGPPLVRKRVGGTRQVEEEDGERVAK